MARKRTPIDPQMVKYKIVLLVLAGFMMFGFLAYLIQYMNLNVIHTVQKPPGTPGILTSYRYDFRYWILFLGSTQGLLLFAALAASMFSGKNRFCSGLWFIVFIVLLIAYIVFFVALAREATNCNDPDEARNICNHPLRCCDPAINGIPASGCDGLTTCDDVVSEFPSIVPPITLDKLGWSDDFVWLFWTTLVFVILDVTLLVILYIITVWEPSMIPDDPLGSSFTTTGGFAVDPGMPLTESMASFVSKDTSADRKPWDDSNIGSRVIARKRVSIKET